MPEYLEQVGGMLLALAAVAAVVFLPALGLWLWRKPRWGTWPSPHRSLHGGWILAWFLLHLLSAELAGPLQRLQFLATEGLNPETVRAVYALLGAALTLPLAFVAMLVLRHLPVRRNFLLDTWFAVLLWLPFTLATFAIYFLIGWTLKSLGYTEDQHPMTRFIQESRGDVRVLLVLSGCLVAPCWEEMLFRGLLVPWMARRAKRVWIVVAFAGLLALASAQSRWGPFFWTLLLVGGLLLLQMPARLPRTRRWPRRNVNAVYTSAMLFAIAHAAVWPTPIPLFFFGLALGWLLVRTGSVWPGIVCHALFNLVSLVYLLRGGGGSAAG